MAANRTARTRQSIVMKRLLELDCPFFEEDDETWLINLFEPSEARMRLLTWLVAKFDSKFGEILIRQAPSTDNRIDSRIQRMLFVCSMMGLCIADDIELIKGTASKKKQTIFWDNLIALVVTAETMKNPIRQYKDSLIGSSIGYASYGSPERNIANADYYDSLCGLIDTFVRKESTNELFSSSVSLFPPDLEKIFSMDIEDKRNSSSTPDNSVLIDIMEKLSSDVDKSRNEYGNFTQEPLEPCQSGIDQQCKKLSLALTMLKQLITNFLHCYEIDMKQWCNRPKAKKSGVGPSCQRTLQMALNHDELLKQMQALENAYQKIKSHVAKQLCTRQSKSEIGYEAIMNLREVIATLRESERRMKDVW